MLIWQITLKNGEILYTHIGNLELIIKENMSAQCSLNLTSIKIISIPDNNDKIHKLISNAFYGIKKALQ